MKSSKSALKRLLLSFHKIGIRFGVHVLPVHYYSPVPDIFQLQRTRNIWAHKSEMVGVPVDLDEQSANLRKICLPFQGEFADNAIYREGVSQHFGPGYGYIEAQAIHGFVRHYKPQRILEIGSGVSTYCMWKACQLNTRDTGENYRITSVEPYPSEALRKMSGIKLVAEQVQRVPLDVFAELGQNDLLFVDSSHTVKPGGDVNYIILEVLPRLRSGVIVHFHDIYFPYDYQRDVLQTFFHWAETSLLQAFLQFNSRARIIACLSHLHYERRDLLHEVFPGYQPQQDEDGINPDSYKPFEPIAEHFPASIFIRML